LKELIRQYVGSAAISLALVVLLAGLASVPGLSAVGLLLAPGMLLAALVFPQGAHSDSPYAYLVLAGVIDVVFYGWLALFVRRTINRKRKSASKPDSMKGDHVL
jgi:hypothetical protein